MRGGHKPEEFGYMKTEALLKQLRWGMFGALGDLETFETSWVYFRHSDVMSLIGRLGRNRRSGTIMDTSTGGVQRCRLLHLDGNRSGGGCI